MQARLPSSSRSAEQQFVTQMASVLELRAFTTRALAQKADTLHNRPEANAYATRKPASAE
jgi:hypothetical protein